MLAKNRRGLTVEAADDKKGLVAFETENGFIAYVDDEGTWYSKSQTLVDKLHEMFLRTTIVVTYYPLPTMRAHALADAAVGRLGGKVRTPPPDTSPEKLKVPEGAIA